MGLDSGPHAARLALERRGGKAVLLAQHGAARWQPPKPRRSPCTSWQLA